MVRLLFHYTNKIIIQVISYAIIGMLLSFGMTTPFSSVQAEEQKALTISLIKNNPPYTFELPDGRPAGFFVEFWELWSQTNEIPIAFEMNPFELSVERVKSRKVDIHSGLFATTARREWGEFSSPIHNISTGALYNDNFDEFTKLSDMVGKKLAAQSGSYQASYVAENHPEIELVLYNDSSEIIYQLLGNDIQGLVSEIPYLHAQVAKLGLAGVFTFAEEVLISNDVHAVVAKGQPELVETINVGLKHIPLRKLINLEKKWFPRQKSFFKDDTVLTSLSLPEIRWINSNPVISIGVESAWPPFEFTDEKGNYSGITADYIDFASTLLDIKMIPVEGVAWSEALEALKEGKIDLMPGVANTTDRAKYMNFTEPFFSLPTVIVTKKDVFYAGTMDALNNKRLGVVEGYVFVELISKDYPGIILQTYSSVSEGLEKVQNGEIDAFIDTIAVINFEINKMSTHDIHIASFSPYNLALSMAVRSGLEPLVGILNKTFASMDDKQKAAIANSWLAIHVQRGTDITTILLWAVPIVSFLMLIIIVFFRTNRRMKNEIVRREKVEVYLAQSKEVAEAASKAKGDFLANMSHEIRTPMNAVIGMAHLLEESGLTEQQQEYLDTLNTSSASLLFLINDILDLSKIEAGKLELEETPFTLEQVVKNISAQVKLHIDPTKVNYSEKIDKSISNFLLGDALRLGQVLLNIANNAMKFTKEGEITISISEAERIDDKVKLLFSISDTGIGMTEVQLKSLFKTYSQADTSTTRKYGGTGLGLAICKSLTELMGGDIWVESIPDQGSTFNFTAIFVGLKNDDPRVIDVQEKDNKRKKAKTNDLSTVKEYLYPRLTNKHVLVVDDNQVNLMIANKILKKEGINVSTAINGEEALLVLEDNTFDAVLMDIQMPVMDGYTATIKIRSNPKYKDLPILALSANVMKEYIDKSIEVGMNTHLSKPLNVDKLLKALDQYIQ